MINGGTRFRYQQHQDIECRKEIGYTPCTNFMYAQNDLEEKCLARNLV